MKTMALLLVSLFSIGTAADKASNTVPNQKIELPQLALTEIAAPCALGTLFDASAWLHSELLTKTPEKKSVFNMPIVAPAENVDLKMVRTPDAITDFKLIVKNPDSTAAK